MNQAGKTSTSKDALRFRAQLVATMAAGFMQSYESWRTFGEEAGNGESFDDWAIRKGEEAAVKIIKRMTK